MRIGSTIICRDERDCKQTLRDLGIAGFHAVRDSVYGRFQIRITGVPDEEYLVQARDQNGRSQKAYCSTLEDAEEIYEEYCNGYAFVEILKGYPGEWESVAQSW